MNLLNAASRFISPQFRTTLADAYKTAQSYTPDRAGLLKAIADRNMTVGHVLSALPLLRSGPVSRVLDAIAPGSAAQLEALAHELNGNQSPTPPPGTPVGNQPRRHAPLKNRSKK
jgi:hypothetical protein